MAKRRIPKPDTAGLRRLKGTAVTGEVGYRKIQNYLTEYDRVVSDYERRWGVERLPLLVSPELRDRFWAQMDRLNDAISREAPIDVEHQVQVTLRAYAALEKEAIAMGGLEITNEAWTAPMKDGGVVAICRDVHQIGNIKKEMPDALVYSVQEVAAILAAWADQNKLASQVKEAFQDAYVSDVKTEAQEMLDDEIPF